MVRNLDGPDFALLKTKEDWKAAFDVNLFRNAEPDSWMLTHAGFLVLRKQRCLDAFSFSAPPPSRYFSLMRKFWRSPYYADRRGVYVRGKTSEMIRLFGGPDLYLENLGL